MDVHTRYFRLPASSDTTVANLCIDIEEDSEDDDELKLEHVCPFCFEGLDFLELCCHIDGKHPIEAECGICPICAKRVGINMAVHTITQHATILKAIYKKKLQNEGSLFCKNYEDEYQEPSDEEPCSMISSADMTADPLLSSFIYSPLSDDKPSILEPSTTPEAKLAERGSDDNILKRNIHLSHLSNKDHEEKAKRCEFVQELLYSTILEDKL